jgi:hypothetical protein
MMPRGRRVLLVALLAFAWLVARPASAQDDAFKEGLSARENDRWAEAAAQMRRAIEADGQESDRVIRSGIGGIFRVGGTPYLPYYFLGEALSNAGDCGGAVQAWETSEEQGVVAGHDEYAAGIRSGYQTCAAQGVLLQGDYRRRANEVDRLYGEAYRLWERLDETRAQNPDLWPAGADADYEQARGELREAQRLLAQGHDSRLATDFASSAEAVTRASGLLMPLDQKIGSAIDTRAVVREGADRLQELIGQAEGSDRAIDALQHVLTPGLVTTRLNARQQLGASRERLAETQKTRDAASLEQGLQLAESAATGLRSVLSEVRRQVRDEAELAWSDAFSFLESSMAILDQRAAQRPDTASALAEALDALREDPPTLERSYERARRNGNVSGIREATRLTEEARMKADQLIRAFGDVTLRDRGVHEALEEGARAYFAGEFQRAIDSLRPTESLDGAPLQVHVHVFRAASLYALYLHSGETNQVLRDAALAAVFRCKGIDPGFVPNERAFSPRFIDFFTRAGSAEALVAAGPG